MFYVKVKDGIAYIKYRWSEQEVIEYRETYVPVSSRDRGIASELASHAIDFANLRNLKIKPQCSFVRDYINKHPEYKNLVKE
jgi:hypothetical protein